MEILKIENLTKVYGKGENEVHALNGVFFRGKRRICLYHRIIRIRQIYITASDWRGGSPDVRQGLCGR